MRVLSDYALPYPNARPEKISAQLTPGKDGRQGAYPCALVLSRAVLCRVAQKGGISDNGVVFALSVPIPEIVTLCRANQLF